ncbi:MAG: carboxypeptidase-like regulatory domain-containing protein [Planctomycetes bacterium]|nr:carboxypeptidase-like regulatory domain-containing protein [Planctomycetota bacterium]
MSELRRRRCLVLVVALSLMWSGPVARAESAPGMSSQGWTGRVVDVEHSQPQPGRQVRLVDPEGRTVTLVTTDEDGAFRVGPLEPGRYWLLVNGVRALLEVRSSGGCNELSVVAPRTLLAEEAPIPMADGLLRVSGSPNTLLLIAGWSVLLLGVGTGAAVAGYNARDRSRSRVRLFPVSPATP